MACWTRLTWTTRRSGWERSPAPTAARVGLPLLPMAIDSDEIRSRADELLDAGAHDPLDTMRHSAAHVMGGAVMELFPDAKLGIGPAIKDGFYYDFELPRPLTPGDLEAIEAKMREQVAADVPFERSESSRDEAVAQLDKDGQPFKVEIVRELPNDDAQV